MHRPLGHQLGDHRLRGGPGDRRLAGQHLVQHRGQRVDVAPGVELPVARGLLRAHVLRRAQREPGLGQAVAARLAHRQRDAEVGQHRLALEQQDVLRLDVAVDHAVAVGVVQRAGDLAGDGERLVQAELVLAVELVPERLAPDQGQHIIEEAALGPRVDQRQDVRVVQPGRDLDLGQEPLDAEHGAQLRPEHLEGDLAVVLEVGGQVDRGHAAGAERALDPVALLQRGRQPAHVAHRVLVGRRLGGDVDGVARICGHGGRGTRAGGREGG